MTYVVDWNNICLVCLQKGENLCVFQKEEESSLSVAEKIMKCSNFIITKSNEQPNTICPSCLSDLNIAYKFRQNCEQSHSIINAILSQEHLKLEVSGLSLRVPLGLKVTKKQPTAPSRDVPAPIQQEEIKDEDFEEIKYSDEVEGEDFDGNDYIEASEILEEIEEDDEKDENQIEETEHLELISEQNEIEPDIVVEKNVMVSKRRPRGRPRKYDRPIKDKVANSNESIRRPFSRKLKGPTIVKPPKICEICGNSYKFQHALNSHMRRHRNERPFNCDFCDKAFVSAVELRRHMRVHTGQKPYECSFCERRFSDYGSRIKHERTHTGERPYECSTCGKSFAYAHVLSVHTRTHTGEKKYVCNECGRGFTKKVYLENHVAHHLSGTLKKRNPPLKEIIRKFEEVKPIDEGDDYSEREYEEEGTIIERYVSEPSSIQPKKEQCEEVNSHDEFYTLHQV